MSNTKQLASAFLPPAPLAMHSAPSRTTSRPRPRPRACVGDKSLIPNSVQEGTISNLLPYGAFVSLDSGHSGLIHISEIARGYVSNISEHVQLGQRVKVKIISVDEEKNRVGLSIRQVRSESVESYYERVVELGGDWGDPWGEDTKFIDLGERVKGRELWEPEEEIFREWGDKKEKE